MKIKQITFYALRALRAIYLEDKEIVTSSRISKTEEISQGVLMRILRHLSKSDILVAHQGRGNVCGGFSLKKEIDDITLLEIIEIMEGTIDLSQMARKPFKDSDSSVYQTIDIINENLRKDLEDYSIREIFHI